MQSFSQGRTEQEMLNPFGRKKRVQRRAPEDPALFSRAESIEPLVMKAAEFNAEKFGIPLKLLHAKEYLGPSPGFPGGVYYWQSRFGEPRGMLVPPLSWELDFHCEPDFFKVVFRSDHVARTLPIPDGWYTVPSNPDEIRVRLGGEAFTPVLRDIHNLIDAMLKSYGNT